VALAARADPGLAAHRSRVIKLADVPSRRHQDTPSHQTTPARLRPGRQPERGSGEMAGNLKWQRVQVAQGMPVQISITGNVATRVVTRFFWLPVSDDIVADRWDRDDGVVLTFDPAKVLANQQNHLAFAARMAPVDPKGTLLVITLRVQQGKQVLFEHVFSEPSSDPTTPVAVDDGIALA
jgi:hypothetical protein